MTGGDGAPWIDLAPLFGFGFRERREAWRHAAACDAARIREALEAAAARGAVVLSLLDERLTAAVRSLPPARRPVLAALIPNVRGMVREATEHGMVGAGWRRARRLGLLRLAGLGLRHLGDGPAVLRRDFPTLLRGLNDVEASEGAGLGVRWVVLHPQMTDLAVAMGNVRIPRDAAALAARIGATPGLATANPDALVGFLAAGLGPEGRAPAVDDRVIVDLTPLPADAPRPPVEPAAGWRLVRPRRLEIPAPAIGSAGLATATAAPPPA